MNIYEKIELNKELVLKIERSVSTAWARKKSTDEIVDEIVKAITDRDQALQLLQTDVVGRSEQLCDFEHHNADIRRAYTCSECGGRKLK